MGEVELGSAGEDASVADRRIAAVRRFNRFYTRRIGVLEEGLLKSPYSLTEVRVLYELAHRDGLTASDLRRDLGLDPGYLSRILRGFEDRGLVARSPSAADARQHILALTKSGRATFAPLDRAARDEVAAMLERLAEPDQARLVAAMGAVTALLGDGAAGRPAYLLRPHQPGDMGWVVQSHGLLYAREYGWDERFEALVAGIVARFIDNFDAKRERCWIAEIDGANVGSVFLVKESDAVARLRLLLVEPRARGLGIGRRLVEECIRFARACRYRKVTLWTNDVLVAARRLYEQAGFTLAAAEPHHSFGHDLVGQTWDLAL